MIAVWRTCVDCGAHFGLTRRQSHAGLRAQTPRCAACRTAESRRRGAIRARNYRLRCRHAKSAPIYAQDTPKPLSGAQRAA